MNFSINENGEITKLKKQLNQKDLQVSQLLNEKERSQGQYAQKTRELQSDIQKLEVEVARLLPKEVENGKLKEDREKQKLEYSNLQQAYNSTRLQLAEKEKGTRLYETDSDRRFQRESLEKEVELDTLREKCRRLEAERSLNGTTPLRNGDAASSMAALQREITTLKAEKERSSTLGSSCAGCSSHSKDSRNLSQSASSEVLQLRASLAEGEKEAQNLLAKLAKAEKEALKAANELIASSKGSNAKISDLESRVADLTDEVAFQRDHLLQKMEQDLKQERGKVVSFESSLKAAREEYSQQELVLKASQDTIATLQKTTEQLCSQLSMATQKGETLREQLVAAEQVAKLLQRRDGEVESARKRVGKLSSALRKVLGVITNGQVLGDETINQSIAGPGNESTNGNLTMNREYEADLLDELEQLLGYVDDADGRVEFAKVEREITESSAANDKRELERRIEAITQELVKVQEESDCQKGQQEQLQIRFDALTDLRKEIEEALQVKTGETENLKCDKMALQDQIAALRVELEDSRKMGTKSAEECESLLESVQILEATKKNDDGELIKLQTNLDTINLEKDQLQRQISDLEERLKTLENTLEIGRNEQQNLETQVQELQKEKTELESQVLQYRSNIVGLERQCQEADLKLARLGLEFDELQSKLREEALNSSRCHIDALSRSLEALTVESSQWNDLVSELRYLLSQSQSQLLSTKSAREEDLEKYSTRLAALEADLTSAKEELQDGKAQIEKHRLDLQASLANQQLAEEALVKFVPGKDTDVTVIEDMSILEASREANELKEMLEQARYALQVSQEKQRTSEDEINDTLEKVQHWKTEVSKLNEELVEMQHHSQEKDNALFDLSARLQEVEAFRNELQATQDQLQIAHGEAKRQSEDFLSKIAAQEATILVLEQEKLHHLQQTDTFKEELQEAQEGYNTLKELMENRNAEYWETKEELAEWQERYERSQADIKIKEDLEERLKEALTEMENTKELSKEQIERCVSLEEKVALALKEIEQSRTYCQSLEAELERSRSESIRAGEIEDQLCAANSLIEQLEQDLAQKAQECEDADDKELTLRKDNKKLAARIANLQAKVEKLQLQTPASRSATMNNGKVSAAIVPSRSIEGGVSSAVSTSTSRKRRAPEEEDQAKEDDRQQAITTRAIYAPKLTTSTANSNIKSVSTSKLISNTKEQQQPPTVAQRAIASQPKNCPETKPFHSPSELLAKKFKSPTKGTSSTLQDRTNLMQPRQLNTLQDGISQGNNLFLTKLNRYRPASNHVVGLGQGTDAAS